MVGGEGVISVSQLKELPKLLWNRFAYQVRLVRVGFKRNNPLFVGVGGTKLLLVAIGVLLLLPEWTTEAGLSWRITSLLFSPSNEIGDALAGVAGALAFLWIIVTVMMQSKELAAQREELRLTREVNKQSANELKAQTFDNFFFELVKAHGEIVNGVDVEQRLAGQQRITHNGRDVFKLFYEKLDANSNANKNVRHPDGTTDPIHTLYAEMYDQHSADLGHYFRFVHNALRAILDNENSNVTHRRVYRSLFSDYELLIIYYNAKTETGQEMLPYLEEFRFFNNLPKNRLYAAKHANWFDPIVFGNEE